MSTADNLNNMLKDILARFNSNVPCSVQNKGQEKGPQAGKPLSLSPSQILVTGALLAGVLEVTSVLVDRDQEVQIILTGSLKRKTELDKLLDQIGSRPFDEVIKAMLGRLG